jgi:hypothetical protein
MNSGVGLCGKVSLGVVGFVSSFEFYYFIIHWVNAL